MKTREEHIAFDMNYCQHYANGKGAGMLCKAGHDLNKVQQVPTGEKSMKWGPCIEGHTLANPNEHCPDWIRRTRETAEERAAAIEDSIRRLTISAPVLNAWRKKPPIGKTEIIECPVCKGRLHLRQAAYNGHVRAQCETDGCIAFIE